MARFRMRHSYFLTFTCLAELKSVTLQGRWMDGRSLITLRGWWPSSGDDKLAPWRPQQTGGGAQESEHIWFLMTAIFPILRNIVLSNSDQQKFWFREWRELPTRDMLGDHPGCRVFIIYHNSSDPCVHGVRPIMGSQSLYVSMRRLWPSEDCPLMTLVDNPIRWP